MEGQGLALLCGMDTGFLGKIGWKGEGMRCALCKGVAGVHPALGRELAGSLGIRIRGYHSVTLVGWYLLPTI